MAFIHAYILSSPERLCINICNIYNYIDKWLLLLSRDFVWCEMRQEASTLVAKVCNTCQAEDVFVFETSLFSWYHQGRAAARCILLERLGDTVKRRTMMAQRETKRAFTDVSHPAVSGNQPWHMDDLAEYTVLYCTVQYCIHESICILHRYRIYNIIVIMMIIIIVMIVIIMIFSNNNN